MPLLTCDDTPTDSECNGPPPSIKRAYPKICINKALIERAVCNDEKNCNRQTVIDSRFKTASNLNLLLARIRSNTQG